MQKKESPDFKFPELGISKFAFQPITSQRGPSALTGEIMLSPKDRVLPRGKVSNLSQ